LEISLQFPRVVCGSKHGEGAGSKQHYPDATQDSKAFENFEVIVLVDPLSKQVIPMPHEGERARKLAVSILGCGWRSY